MPGFVQFVNYGHIRSLNQYVRLNYGILTKQNEKREGLFLELIDDPFGEFVSFRCIRRHLLSPGSGSMNFTVTLHALPYNPPLYEGELPMYTSLKTESDF